MKHETSAYEFVFHEDVRLKLLGFLWYINFVGYLKKNSSGTI